MNQFLDQFLNPIPINKKKSQSQNNNEVARNKINGLKDNEQEPFDHISGNQSQGVNQNPSYERQQVTQELIFENDDDNFNKQTRKNVNMQNSYSLGGLREVRQVKIMNNAENDLDYLRSEESYPENSQVLVNQQIYEDQYEVINSDRLKLNQGIGTNHKVIQELIEGINTAKQTQLQFSQWLSQQKTQFDSLISLLKIQFSKKVQQVTQKIRQQVRKQMQNKSSQEQSVLSTQKKWQIEKKLIKQELQQRYLYRIQKLEQQLAQKKQYEQEMYENKNKISNDFNSEENSHSKSQIERLNQQLQLVKFQLNQKNTLISQMELENQKLNQHIFDVQQKIQGIELQVENKVRERIKQLQNQRAISPIKEAQPLNPILELSSHLEQSSRAMGMQSFNVNSPKFEEIIAINQILKQKIEQMQFQKASIENQLKEHQKILSFREQQIQQNQHDINFEWAEIQKQRQSILIRQQQLTTAEENISKKIAQIRYKQSQFDKWQNQLHTRQVNLDFKDEEFNKKLEELVERQNIFKIEKQKFIKEKQMYSNLSNNMRSRKNIQQFNTQGIHTNIKQNDTEILNHHQMNRKYYQQPDFKQEKSFQNEYQFKSKPDFMKNNLERSYDDIDKSYTRQNRQRQRALLSGNNFRPQQRQSHQFILPQNNSRIVQHHSRSKSKSKQKIVIRNNLYPTSNLANYQSTFVNSNYKNTLYKPNTRFNEQIHQNKSQSNLDGLGSKLQRLRDEIKRQIDSIK